MDLNETRGNFPTHVATIGGKQTECLIPFSSEIKFNLFIRDMAKNTESDNNNLCVYMKGAPERILVRCSKILVNG
jgi:magnesium-transporting ATPase (P-type)